MRLFVDLDLQAFVLGPSTTQEVSSIEVKRGPATEIEIQFLRGVTPQELSSSASGTFEVKVKDEYDSSPLTAALAWTKTGTGEDTIYTFSLPLVNAPLDALLGVDSLHTFSVVAATDLFTSVAHGLTAGTVVQFSSTVTLPAPLLPNVDYFVIASGLTANDFRVSTTLAGSTVDITTTGTGIHSFRRTTNDIPFVTLMAAMQWEADGRTSETQTIDFVLLNDVVRAGDIPPAFPALVYAVFLPEILTLANFKAVPTVGMQLGYIVQILVDVAGTATWYIYRLESGPATEAEPQHVEPDDYDLSTNNVHWNGAEGPPGSTGTAAGLSYKFNTATSGDPTTGRLLLNNATVASATAINIHETDDDGHALAPLLLTWDDSTSTIRGRLQIFDPATPANFAIFNVTGTITDAGAYDTFVIAHVASGGTLTNGLSLRVLFFPTGDKGGSGAGYVATSTTSFLIGTGLKAFTTQAGLAYTAGARVRVTSQANSANWMEGLVTAYSGTTLTVTIDLTNGSGTLADWNINLTGERGATGATGGAGPGYTATSATSFSVSTGSKAFTTQTGLAYTVGARTRVSSAANTANWMEGLVTAYSGSTLTILVDLINGTGTHTDWNINLAGQQGQTGATGGTTYDAAGTIPAGTSGVDINLTTLSMTSPRVLTGNTDFDLVSPVNGKVTIVHIKQAAASSYTVTINGTVVWMGTGGVAPSQSTGFDVIDTWTFWYDGVNLYGAYAAGE